MEGHILTIRRVAIEILLILISLDIAFSQDLTPYEFIAENITTINKSDPGYWLNQGDAFSHSGKYVDAIESLKKAIELNQSLSELVKPKIAQCWNDRGVELTFMGSLYKPIIEEGKLIYNPKYDEPKIQNELVYDLSLDPIAEYELNEAVKAFENTTIDPYYTSGFWNKGNALVYLNRYDEAIQNFTKAVDINPRAHDAESLSREIDRIWYIRGTVKKLLGHNSEAIAAFANVSWMPYWMEFFTFNQGQGFNALLVLHDKVDKDASCDGKLRIEVYDDSEYREKLWGKTFNVEKGNFTDYSWGVGREANAWKLNRIAFDEIQYGAEDPTWYARAYFDSPDGKILKDTAVI